jgi:hypothetical protein
LEPKPHHREQWHYEAEGYEGDCPAWTQPRLHVRHWDRWWCLRNRLDFGVNLVGTLLTLFPFLFERSLDDGIDTVIDLRDL